MHPPAPDNEAIGEEVKLFNKQYGALAIDETVPNWACFYKKLTSTVYDYLPVKVIR